VLINAAKYTPAGGHIAMTVSERCGSAVVSVRDDGNGIAAADLERIFEMFGQVGTGTHGGLGIGLSLARRLALLHGGSVEARSDGPGLGSEFEIRLPLMPAAHEPSDTPFPGTDGAATASEARTKRRILVADDLRDTADSLARLLAELGHHVIVAYDGEDALRQVEAHRPDVVLLDLGMPKIDGCEVARRIRAQSWSAGMRLIAQTGWGQESDRQRTREAGFDAHFVKPLDLQSLLAAVESAP
jgi:CheY-like chemotaxis protein